MDIYELFYSGRGGGSYPVVSPEGGKAVFGMVGSGHLRIKTVLEDGYAVGLASKGAEEFARRFSLAEGDFKFVEPLIFVPGEYMSLEEDLPVESLTGSLALDAGCRVVMRRMINLAKNGLKSMTVPVDKPETHMVLLDLGFIEARGSRYRLLKAGKEYMARWEAWSGVEGEARRKMSELGI